MAKDKYKNIIAKKMCDDSSSCNCSGSTATCTTCRSRCKESSNHAITCTETCTLTDKSCSSSSSSCSVPQPRILLVEAKSSSSSCSSSSSDCGGCGKCGSCKKSKKKGKCYTSYSSYGCSSSGCSSNNCCDNRGKCTSAVNALYDFCAIVRPVRNLALINGNTCGDIKITVAINCNVVTLQWEGFTGQTDSSGISYLYINQSFRGLPKKSVYGSYMVNFKGGDALSIVEVTSDNNNVLRWYLNSSRTSNNVSNGENFTVYPGSISFIISRDPCH